MKTFKQFLEEARQVAGKNRVFRVDPTDRPVESSWSSNDYAVLRDKNTGTVAGTAPLRQGHTVRAGDTHLGHDVDRIERNTTFATPHRGNAFYGAFTRKGGADGQPVRGAAVFDQEKMFGAKRDKKYKGEIHTTREDFDKVPEKVTVSSADADGFSTKDYSGKDEVTSDKPAQNIKSKVVNTKRLIRQQYRVVFHPDHASIKAHLAKVQKEAPHLSVLDQT